MNVDLPLPRLIHGSIRTVDNVDYDSWTWSPSVIVVYFGGNDAICAQDARRSPGRSMDQLAFPYIEANILYYI